MARIRCEKCGEKFTSQQNFEFHQDLVDCAPDAENESVASAAVETEKKNETTTTSSATRSTPQRGPLATGATGTVQMFDDERGYGFVTTADVTQAISEEAATTQDIFFHISETGTDWMEEGDRLEFDIIPGDEGPEATNIEVLKRDRDRDTYDEPEDDPPRSRLGFGHQKDDGMYGHGTASSTPSDIEGFQDERKFR